MQPPPVGPLFVFPPTSGGVHWIHVLPFLAAVPALALLVRGLMRGRLSEVAGGLGLVILPVATYALAAFMMIEESKDVRFCGSCHVMAPIRDSVSQDNGSLAAIHYTRGRVPYDSACFVCHSGYGMWGTVSAKLAGLRHMMHTVTGHYERPIKLAGTFDIDSCLNCHARSQAFRAVEAHQDHDLQESLVSRQMSCTGVCHPAAHPEDALNGGGPAS